MKGDVGMSKHKKHANKIKTPLPHNPTFVFCFISTYVGLYGSGLFNFGSHLTLFACFLCFEFPTSPFILLEMFFIILVNNVN